MSNKKICYHFDCYLLMALNSGNIYYCPDCSMVINEKEIIRVNNIIDKRGKLNKVLNKIG